jgi:hypothetical protein
MTRGDVAVEQVIKHVSAEMNTRINRRAVFSVWSVPRGCKKGKEDHLRQLSFETPACQDTSLGAEELNCGIKASELLSAIQLKVERQALKRRL